MLSFDITNGPEYDLLRPAVQSLILGWIRGGCVLGAWLGTPCTTFSRARHPALRTNTALWGKKGLSSSDSAKVRVGNACLRFSLSVIRLGLVLLVPVFLENPATSMIFSIPTMCRYAKAASHNFVTDYCQHGARWRKRTRVLAWNAVESEALHRQCSGRGGLCSSSGKHHIVLRGQDPVSRRLWTSIAQPYPDRFAAAACRCMIDSAAALHLRRLQQLEEWQRPQQRSSSPCPGAD